MGLKVLSTHDCQVALLKDRFYDSLSGELVTGIPGRFIF